MAPDAQKWNDVLGRFGNDDAHGSGCSLNEMFSLFTEDRLSDLGRRPSVMELRLLLHPLHSLVANYGQIITNLNARSKQSPDRLNRTVSSHSQTFNDIHTLCKRWLIAFETIDVNGARLVTVARATLMQYHLICLNLLCCFKSLETFSRRERPEELVELACNIQSSIGTHIPEAFVHCGQILRLIRSTDTKLRPPWWSVAMYRATIVLWVGSITRKYMLQQRRGIPLTGPRIALDQMAGIFDPALSRYLAAGFGTPCLSDPAQNGALVDWDNPRAILQTCIEAFGRGPRLWRLTRGLQSKLEAMSRDWESTLDQLELA